MTVSLTNTSNRCQVFVLAHETYCKTLGQCACDLEQGRASRRTPRSTTPCSPFPTWCAPSGAASSP